jgi:hypothetical protein
MISLNNFSQLVFKVEAVFSVTHRVIESHRVAMVTIRIGLCVTLPNNNVRSYSTMRCQYSDRWNYAWFALGVRLAALLFVFGISSRGRDSSVGIATRYGLDDPGIEFRWGEIFHTGPGVHPASYTMGTGSFPGVKRPGGGVDQPPPSSPEVKERVELHLYSSSGPSWPVLG